jgi:hypothetical protein
VQVGDRQVIEFVDLPMHNRPRIQHAIDELNAILRKQK